MPRWYGMENVQKPEMGKKGNPNGKQPPAGQEQNMAKTGFSRELSIFSLHFWAIFAPVERGAVSHLVFHFFPFPALAGFPCHASPTWSQSEIEVFKQDCKFQARMLFQESGPWGMLRKWTPIARFEIRITAALGCTPRGSCNNTLLR